LKSKRRGSASIRAFLCFFSFALADLCQVEAEESTNTLEGLIAQKEFKVELVASEPQVIAPVALAFDENGRLFVAEMPSPPEGRATGRIRLLEDPEGDGSFTASSVFAEDVPWPTSIACYDSGLFVAATPDILYLKDTKGKGLADLHRKVFSGFGGENPRGTDPERLVTSLRWGPDGRVHGLTAGIGGQITSLTSREAVELGRNDFSFDPRTLDFRPELGPGQSTLAFDSRGRKYITDAAQPLRVPTYELEAMARNPFAPPPMPFVDVMSPATVVVKQVDAAREPTAGKTSRDGREQTNTTAPTSLSFARGTVFYAGNAYPTNYLDNVFIADPNAGVVHRAVLRQTGLFPVVERSPQNLRSEFLSTTEKEFYPADMVNGPDGVLYVADRRRGADQGRIYRVVPSGFKRPKTPQLGKMSSADLVVLLAHANGWHRETAARLLYERQDPAAIGPLTNMVNNSRLPVARLRALQALAAMGALNERVLLKTFRDPDARVREQAVYAAQNIFRTGPGSDEFRNQLQALAADPSINVRYQLAFTLGAVPRPGRAAVLAEILFREPANLWFQSAVLSSLDLGAPEFMKSLAINPRYRSVPALQALLPEVTQMIGVRGQLDEVKPTLGFLHSAKLEAQIAYGLMYHLGEGLQRTRSSLRAVDPQNALLPFYEAALVAATDADAAAPVRVQATRVLGMSAYTYADIGDWLLLLLAPKENPQVQQAAVLALTRMPDPRAVSELLKRWQSLSVPARQQGIAGFLSRNDRIGLLLTALQNRTVPFGDLGPAQLDFLRTFPDPAMSQWALQLLGPVQLQRPAVMEKFKAAARLPGIVSNGRGLFMARCASCHWTSLGPGGVRRLSLTPIRTRAKDQILSAIIEPGATIRPEDKTYVVETKQGEYYVGLLLSDNPTAVSLLQADGTPVALPHTNIQAVRPLPWSLMPAGLEAGLSPQSLADILEFTARPE
jgi:putative membrane-bound dehydrogenase-like protein